MRWPSKTITKKTKKKKKKTRRKVYFSDLLFVNHVWKQTNKQKKNKNKKQ